MKLLNIIFGLMMLSAYVNGQLAETTSAVLPPQIVSDVIIKNPELKTSQERIDLVEEYNADKLMPELYSDSVSWECVKECWMEFKASVKEDTLVRAEFYTDKNQNELSKAIGYYRVLAEIDGKWTEVESIRAGDYRMRIDAVVDWGTDNQVEVIPVLEPINGDVYVRQSRWVLWMKGSQNNNTIPNMQASYHLDSDATDYTGNGNTGTTKSGTYTTPAVFNNSWSGIGAANYIYMGDKLDQTGAFSISAWAKPAKLGTMNIAGKYNDVNDPYPGLFDMRIDVNGKPSWYVYDTNFNTGYITCTGVNGNLVVGSWTNTILRYNGGATATDLEVWINGVNVTTSCTEGGTFSSPKNVALNFTIGAIDNRGAPTRFWNGSIDEVYVFDRALSPQEMRNLYESGITQGNWSIVNASTLGSSGANVSAVIGFGDQTLASNITYTNSSGGVNLLRTNAGAESNTTGLQLTKLNATHYQVLDFSTKALGVTSTVTYNACGGNALITCVTQSLTYTGYFRNDSLNVTWINQEVPDLDTLNAVGPGLNITYYVNSSEGSISVPLISSIKLCHYTNNTLTNNVIFVNGSVWNNVYECQPYTRNDSAYRSYSTVLEGNNIYPGVYNLNETLIEITTHTANTLSNNNAMVKIQLYNFSTNTSYNFFEVMTNCSGGTTPAVIYYCNSTYTTGNVVSSPNCVSIGSINCVATYNHTHRATTTPYSSHQIFPFGLSGGELNNIVATPLSYFILQGANVVNWKWFSISSIARASATQTSANTGVTWSNFAGSLDAHVHQFTNQTSLWYYQSVTNQSGYWFNSSVREDKMQLAGLAPTSPDVYFPVSQNYSVSVPINYTASVSPNSYAINNYSIRLYNNEFTQLEILSSRGGSVLGWDWIPTTQPNTNYVIGVIACDTLNQCSSIGFSQEFTLDTTAPTVTITAPTNTSYLYMLGIPLVLSAVDTNMPISKIWYSLDTGPNITYTVATTFDTSNGGHVLRAYANDTLGNVGQSNVAFTAQPIPPYITAYTLNPVDIFWSQSATASITLAAGDGTIDKLWIRSASGTILNITTGVVGTQQLPYYPNGAYGVFNVYAYVNDTDGYTRYSGPITLTVQPPRNASNDQLTNDLTFGRPLQAAVGVYTALLGGLFWAIIIGVIFVALWLRTNNFLYPTLILFTLTTLLGMELPNIAQQLSYGVYFVALGLIIWKLISPSYTQ